MRSREFPPESKLRVTVFGFADPIAGEIITAAHSGAAQSRLSITVRQPSQQPLRDVNGWTNFPSGCLRKQSGVLHGEVANPQGWPPP